MQHRWTALGCAVMTVLVVGRPARSAALCVGDCDADGGVTVNEVIRGVSVALGSAPLAACTAFDANGDSIVSVDEILLALNNALNACLDVQPPPTVTAPLHPTPTATATSIGASTLRLTSEETLQIEFTTHPPFVEQNPNTIYVFLGNVNRIAPYGLMSGSLYDGDTLLGLSTSTSGACATGTYSLHPAPTTWKSAASPWDHPAGDPSTVDFTSLLDGTIQGRIDIEIDSGSFDFNPSSVSMGLLHATSANGGSSIPPVPRVRSVTIAPRSVPPGTPRVCPIATATVTRTGTPTGAAPTATLTSTRTPTRQPTVVASATPSPTEDDDDD